MAGGQSRSYQRAETKAYAADRDRINERRRERNFTDVEYAERERERKLEWYREQSATDPEFAERSRKRQRERYATDPEYAERQREKSCGRLLPQIRDNATLPISGPQLPLGTERPALGYSRPKPCSGAGRSSASVRPFHALGESVVLIGNCQQLAAHIGVV